LRGREDGRFERISLGRFFARLELIALARGIVNRGARAILLRTTLMVGLGEILKLGRRELKCEMQV